VLVNGEFVVDGDFWLDNNQEEYTRPGQSRKQTPFKAVVDGEGFPTTGFEIGPYRVGEPFACQGGPSKMFECSHLNLKTLILF
jgi:hypothetical protein